MSSFLKYPLIPVRNTVVFPGTVISLIIGRTRSVAALEEAKAKKILVVVATQKLISESDPKPDDLYKIGTLCSVEKMDTMAKRGYQIVIRAVSRFRIAEFIPEASFLSVTGEYVSDAPVTDPLRLRALLANLKEMAKEILGYMAGADQGLLSGAIDEVEDPSYLANLAATYINISTEQKQRLLEEVVVEHRIETLLSILNKEREVLKLQKEIQEKMSEHMTQAQRRNFLKEQIKTIQEELGETEEQAAQDLEKKVESAKMPPEILKIAKDEMERLKNLPPQSSEYHVVKNYLELLAEMPWQKATHDEINLEQATKILDQDHYGLEDVKNRILDFLSVAKLKNDLRGPILCLLGPPGVGKTSLGQSIARVLGKKFIRISLGGVRDEAEIRGHRRTYVGAMPGRIIEAIKRVGVNNPLFMLDEIDKLGASYQGDPASAMLEVLDPEQNKTFVDHYLDVPFDLSNVFFVGTANMADTIPAPLMDRMEIIEITGYTVKEKEHIARKYLIPRQVKEHGLKEDQIVLSAEVLEQLVTRYTRESGVRELQRQIAAVCRWTARSIVKGKTPPFVIDPKDLTEILGPEKFIPEVSQRVPRSGVTTGMAWTPQGGEILIIETNFMKGRGELILTGQLGSVMKESAQIAMSFLRSTSSQFNPEFEFEHHDIHVHVPAGAIPKDGPSAGITILTALVSLLSGRTVDPKLAMTGEITLRGAVLPVGGIKEKILAAHRAGIKKIILPKRNHKDLLKVPEEVKSQLEISFAETADEVLKLTLNLNLVERPTIRVGNGKGESSESASIELG